MLDSKQEITQIAKQWANDWYQDLIEHDLSQGPRSREESELYEEAISGWLWDAREGYSLNNFSRSTTNIAKSLLEEPVETSSINFKFLCQEITRQTIKVYEHLHSKVSDGTPLPESLYKEENLINSLTIASTQSGHSISEVYDSFSSEKIKSGEWSRKRTENENALAIRMLQELIGDIDISSVTKETGRAFKERLLRYPAQREKLAHLKHLPIEEIIDGQIEYETISIRTASNRFVKVTAFFNWAENNGYIASNPLSNMGIKVKTNRKDSRQPFSSADLQAIFSSPIFTEGKHKHDYYYWLPLIAIYTGARIEEICQLNLTDIKETNGVLCFHITDDGEGQQLKNNASRRFVPIHSKLIELGLLHYISHRQASGEKMLLPGLQKISERYSHNPSKWFGRLKRTLSITAPTKTFHSFRHSVIDHLRGTQAPDYAIKEIVGHTDESTTHGVYGSRNPAPLEAVINSINWGDALLQVKPYTSKS